VLLSFSNRVMLQTWVHPAEVSLIQHCSAHLFDSNFGLEPLGYRIIESQNGLDWKVPQGSSNSGPPACSRKQHFLSNGKCSHHTSPTETLNAPLWPPAKLLIELKPEQLLSRLLVQLPLMQACGSPGLCLSQHLFSISVVVCFLGFHFKLLHEYHCRHSSVTATGWEHQ